MDLPNVKKPVCQNCGERESVVVCGAHRAFFCGPCSEAHQSAECYFNAAPGCHALTGPLQITLPLSGVEGTDL